MMEEAHRRAGHWLRKFYPRPLFLKLADNLRAGAKMAEDLRMKRPPKLGTILPKPLPEPEVRQGRPVQVLMPGEMPHGDNRYAMEPHEPENKSPAGLIIPDGVTLQ